MNSDCCGNCLFCLRNGDDKRQGYCRRSPPTLLMIPQVSRQSPLEIGGRKIMTPARMGLVSQFPPVRLDIWCGEHRLAESLQAELDSLGTEKEGEDVSCSDS